MHRAINWRVWLGDMVVLVSFAAIGRQSHAESNPFERSTSRRLRRLVGVVTVGSLNRCVGATTTAPMGGAHHYLPMASP
jgi:hypothetical protein